MARAGRAGPGSPRRARTRCSAARSAAQVREVGLGVLPGVEHHGDVRGGQVRPAAAQTASYRACSCVDHVGELGDVGAVAGVGVPDQRDPAVPGDDQAEPDQAQVGAFLLGLAPLRDRRLVVAGVDEGGEVGHVQRHAGHVQAEGPDDPRPRSCSTPASCCGVTACIASQNRRWSSAVRRGSW